MKLTNKFIAAGLVIAFTFSSCSNEKLLDLNQNPNAAEDIDMGYLFAYAQLTTSGGRYENWRAMLIYSSTMMQHFATLPTYWSGDKYLHNNGYSSSLFDSYYPSAVKHVVHVMDKTAGNPEMINYNACARILRGFIFQRLTDMYGDVPYFQAGRGLEGDQNWRPKYDTQQEIYNDVINELLAAGAALDASKPTMGIQDLMFGGNVAQWKKWAGSLLLRMGTRVQGVDNALATKAIEGALSLGVMTDNVDIAKIDHYNGPSGLNKNGIGEVFNWNGKKYTTDDSPRLSQSFVALLNGKSDPRLDRLSWRVGVLGTGGAPKGLPNGFNSTTIQTDPSYVVDLDDTDAFGSMDDYSRITPDFVLLEAPMVFQSYAEVEFLLAEAAENGYATGKTAAEHYADGVTAAMQMYGSLYGTNVEITQGEIAAYLIANPYDVVNWFQQLAEEYYVATLLNEYETFANWRRTGFPVLTPTNYPGNVTGGQIPRRLVYPAGEEAVNPDNFKAATGGKTLEAMFMEKVWWDVN